MDSFQNTDFGTPFVGTGSAIKINQRSIAGEFSKTALYRYIRISKQFEIYDAKCGIWLSVSCDEVKNRIFNFALSLQEDQELDDICAALTDNILNAITRHLQCLVGVDENPVPKSRCIHLKNSMLIFDENINDFISAKFSPEYNSRCQLDINYNPQAKCPRFIN